MDREEFIEIVNENRKLIYKVCNLYCPDPTDREDLQQDILSQLWLSMDKYDGRVKMSTWIYRLSLNIAISSVRKRKRRREHNPHEDISLFSFVPDDELDPDREADLHLLRVFIGELGEMDKALMLLWLDRRKYSEIAEIMGISEANVGTRVGRIKARLREKFEKINGKN